MQCLNIKNKEVAALLKEYTKILGNENAAYYVLSENNGYGLDKAPNGEPSKLFSDLLEHYNGDRVAAIQAKARTYSKSFKEWFGDWQSEDKTNVSKVVDENSEPLLVWHGTTENFDAFSKSWRGATDPGDWGLGFYFSPKKSSSEMYGNILMPVFLSIKNPVPNEKFQMINSFGREKVKPITLKEKIQEDIKTTKFTIKGIEEQLYGNDPDYELYRKEGSLQNIMHKKNLERYKDKLKDLQTQLQTKSKEELDYDINKKWNDNIEDINKYDGVIPNINSGKAIKENYEIVAREPNQIKSIDNQGTFSTQDNNIYNQKAATQKATGRNKELALLLQELYPNIEIAALADPNLRGQAQVEGYMAGRVLLNTLLENQDTLPHEYAHHYIAWFRNAPIVQRGIKQFGSEESLVQAIGENSVKALKWYNRFFNWVKGLFNEKQDTLNEITKAFLSGRTLDNSYFFGKEIHNQKVAKIPEAVNKVYDKLMESIKRRIKDIQYAKYSDSKKVDELRALEFKLNQLENDQATFEFVDYMASDIISALNEIKALQAKVKENQKYDNPLNVTSAELDVIKKGYIGFYGNIATNIQNMLDDESTFDYLMILN